MTATGPEESAEWSIEEAAKAHLVKVYIFLYENPAT
jgi:hypothetical protein